ncbi:MAG: catalase family peroxidase [Pirellulaceae bacterium]|nr:catalase family peroxidase [Pirellulaceae bacterium]
MPSGDYSNLPLAEELLSALDALSGLHPGFRPAHAKGVMCAGTFAPASTAAGLTSAPHAVRPKTPVTVRFSDSTGVPTIPDNDPAHSGPRGIGIRFHLAEHEHTDIVAHSTNGFPVRTGEDFLQFLRGAAAAAAGNTEALGSFLAAHPAAKRFVETPKPIPSSFARESFFAITSFQFTSAEGATHHGRFRILPAAGTDHLSDDEAARRSPNFLFEELRERLARGPIRLEIVVQLAESGDDVTDASTPWPETRRLLPFGTLTLSSLADDQSPELRKVMFDPVPRVAGIDSSGDPLTETRSDIYLLSGRRRRGATPAS